MSGKRRKEDNGRRWKDATKRIERTNKGIERRLEEAKQLIQLGFYRNAVETASGAIEMLMRNLFEELKIALRRSSNLEEYRKNITVEYKLNTRYNDLVKNGTFGEWIHVYNTWLFKKLSDTFHYKFTHFDRKTLWGIHKRRNQCVHNDYLPTKAEAGRICNQLELFLEETKRAPQARQDQELTKEWHQEWDRQIRKWLESRQYPQKADIMSALVDQLRLLADLIGDGRVPGELKAQLMQAIVYVIEPDDFISEEDHQIHGLVDDAAVLAFTLYWLNDTGIIKPTVLRDHWVGNGDPIKVTKDLCRRITNNHKKHFNKEAWETISAIAENGPMVLWKI